MSATQTPMLASFNGGELSRRMHGRVDTQIYQIAVEAMENFAPTIEGCAVKRPGFEYIKAARASASWLSPFIFSVTQAYVLEWSEGKLRFFTNGGRIETAPNVPYEVTVPYTAAEASEISAQQSFDRLYLAHANHPSPARLSRTGATTFVYDVPELDGGPFADENINEGITVTTSGVTGSVTVTASAAIFQPGHVGALFRIEAKDYSTVTAWEPGYNDVTVGLKVRSDGKVYQCDQVGTKARTGTIQPVHTRGSEWDGGNRGEDINAKDSLGCRWAYLHDQFGIGRITAVAGDGLSCTMTVLRRLPDQVQSIATHRWSHAMFSAAAGWPSIVIIAFGRLFLFRDFEMVASVAGDYLNFRAYDSAGRVQPDLSFRRRLSLSNPPLWAKADRKKILIGTADGLYSIEPVNPAEPISGSNIDATPQSFHGAAQIPPAQIGTETIYATRGRRGVRAADYDFGRDRNATVNPTVWARHIARGVRQLGYQQNPEELLFGVRDDGQLFLHPRAQEQEIKGFARIIPAAGGKIRSAVAVPADDGGLDEIWALIERDGARSIERLARWWDEDDGMSIEQAFFVDSGVTFTGAIASVSSGLEHLNGRTVAVVADGAIMADQVVTAGGLPSPIGFTASTVHVGLRYPGYIRSLRPDVRDAKGQTSQGKRKRLVRLILRLLETAGIRVRADGVHADNVIDRPGSAQMDAPVPLFTGDTSKTVTADWGRDGQFELISDDPLPCIVIGAMPHLEVSEK